MISWKDLKGSDLLVLGLKSVCFEELVALERDRQAIADYLRGYALAPPIYKAELVEPEYITWSIWGSFYKLSDIPQSIAWTLKAIAAATSGLEGRGISLPDVAAIVSKAVTSIPIYTPVKEVDFTGFLKSLDEERGIKWNK